MTSILSSLWGYVNWMLSLNFGKTEYRGRIVFVAAILVLIYLIGIVRRLLWRRNNFSAEGIIRKISHWPSWYGETVRLLAHLAAIGLLAIILFEPINSTSESFPIREPAFIAVGLDDSMSMLAKAAPDSPKSRLDVAKDQIESIVSASAHEGSNDRLLLFSFADEPYKEIKDFTSDYGQMFLPALDMINDFYSRAFGYGTDFAKALKFCADAFPKTESPKFCLIFTDGEPEGADLKALDNNFQEALSEWRVKSRGIRLYFVVVGAAERPEKIYKFDNYGNYTSDVELDDNGKAIETRSRPDYMRQAATKAGGGFVHLKYSEEPNPVLQQVVEKDKKIIGWKKVNKVDDVSDSFIEAYLVVLVLILILI